MSSVTLCGKEFRTAEKVGLMPLLRFAHFARQGASTDDIEAMDAMYTMLRSVIADDEWDAFVDHASAERAGNEDLLDAVKGAIEVISSRPTVSPSDSSDGQPTTEMSGSGDSSATVFSIHGGDTALLRDPRVQELIPLSEAARRVATG